MSDDSESKSRLMVLRTICEQLQLSHTQGNHGPQEAWTQMQWRQSFDFLFDNDRASSSSDDLLFFVHATARSNGTEQHQDMNQLDSGMTYSVRRKGQPLPASFSLSGPLFPLISWSESLLLNLVMSCSYTLTVATCPLESLGLVASGAGGGLPSSSQLSPGQIRSISRQVYANITQTTVNLRETEGKEGAGRKGRMRLCYPPDICFAVESFHEDFSELVLTPITSCYCVSLSVDYGHLLDACESGRGDRRQAIVFSGFVSYEQVGHQMDRQNPPSFLGGQGQRERVLMAGPGGLGIAEVAVTDHREGNEAGSLSSLFKSIIGILGVDEGKDPSPAVVSPPLQCSLMSMRLPVDSLARMILEASIGIK